jgi:hypothetical protein
MDIGVSDVCHGWPGIGPYAATQAAHTFIGGVALFIPLSLRLVILGGWIGKELFSDMARCELSALVALDSAADLGFAVLGFALAHWKLAQDRARV